MAVFYLAFNYGFLSSNYEFDGTVFSLYIEAVKAGAGAGLLFHPHHLIFEPLAYLFFNLLWLLGLKVRSILALEIFASIISSINLAVFGLNLFMLKPERKLPAIFCALGLGFSYAYWFFSVQPAELSLALLFLNLGFYIIIRTGRKQKDIIPAGRAIYIIFMLGICASFAAFGHIMHSLFLIPILYFAFRIFSFRKSRSRLRPLSAIILVAGIITGSLYLIGFLLQPMAHSQSEALPKLFLKWVIGNALIETPFGYKNSYWNLGLSGPAQWFSGLAWAFFWKPAKTLEMSVWGGLKAFCLLLMAISIGIYIYKYIKNWSQRELYDDFILLWIITGGIFTVFWAPGYYEQKMYILPPLWSMICLGWPWPDSWSGKIIASAFLSLMIIILFAFNFLNGILPDSRPEHNQNLSIAEQIKDFTEPDSSIIISGIASTESAYYFGKIYIPYFSQRKTIVLDWSLSKPVQGKHFPQNLAAIISGETSSGHKTYLLSEALSEPVLEALSRHHRIASADLRGFWNRFALKPVAKLEGGMELYRVDEKPDH